jgi:hypothetical protein
MCYDSFTLRIKPKASAEPLPSGFDPPDHHGLGRTIMSLTRRTVLTAGAMAAARAAAPGIFAQQSNKTGTGKFYERGPVRIYYEEAGSGLRCCCSRAGD